MRVCVSDPGFVGNGLRIQLFVPCHDKGTRFLSCPPLNDSLGPIVSRSSREFIIGKKSILVVPRLSGGGAQSSEDSEKTKKKKGQQRRKALRRWGVVCVLWGVIVVTKEVG